MYIWTIPDKKPNEFIYNFLTFYSYVISVKNGLLLIAVYNNINTSFVKPKTLTI